MSCTNSLNRRLLWAIIRTSHPSSTAPSLHRPPQSWTRAISSTAERRLPPTVSFGTENDAFIEEYAPFEAKKRNRLGKRERASLRSASASNTASDPKIDQPTPDFEIAGYVDRSTQKPTPAPVTTTAEHVSKPATEPATTRTKEPTHTRKRTSKASDIPEDSERVEGTEPQPSKRDREIWQIQKDALRKKFPQGWNPRKKLSPDAMDGIRELHEQDPERYSTALLADQFKVSAESIRRILKSKWQMKESPEKMAERRERWAKRHDRIWDIQSELGLRPKRKKDKEVEGPDKFEMDLQRRELLGNR